MSTYVHQGCPNAGNPYHECNDRCLEGIISRNVPKKEKKRFGFVPGFGKPSSPSHVNAGTRSPLPSFYEKRKVETDESPSFSSSNDSIKADYFSPRSPFHERSSKFQPKNVDVNDANSEKDVLPMSPSLAEYSNRDYFASKFNNRGGEALVRYEEDAEMSPGPNRTQPMTLGHHLTTSQQRPFTRDTEPRILEHDLDAIETTPRTPEHRSSTSDNRLWRTNPESSAQENTPKTPEHRSSTSDNRLWRTKPESSALETRHRTPEHRSKISDDRPMTPEHESFAALRPRPKTPDTRLRTAEHRVRSPEYGQRSSGPWSETPETQGSYHHSQAMTPEPRTRKLESSSPVIPQIHPISHRSLDIDRPTSPLNVETQPISHRSLDPPGLRSPRRVNTPPQTPKHQPISSETRVRTRESTLKAEEYRARPSGQRPRLLRQRSRTPEPQVRYLEPRARMPEVRSRTPEPGPRTRQNQPTSFNIDDSPTSPLNVETQPISHGYLDPPGPRSPRRGNTRPQMPKHQPISSETRVRTQESTLKAEEYRARPSDQRPRLSRIRSRTPEPQARYQEPRARMPEARSRTPEPGPRTRQNQLKTVNIDDKFFSAAQRSSQASKYVELTWDSVYTEDEEESLLSLPEFLLSPQENRTSRFTTPNRIDKPTRHEEIDQIDESESIYDQNSQNSQFLNYPDDNSSYLYPEVATPIHHKYRKSTDKQYSKEPPELPEECKSVSQSETERMEELQICKTDEETQSTISSESYVSIESYKVRSSVSATLQQILDKHGDIASGSKPQSMSTKSYYLDTLAAVVLELQSTPLKHLKESRVQEMVAVVKDIESMKIKASWLSEVLSEILEATKHYDRHKTTVMEKKKCERDVLRGKQKMEKIVEELTWKEKEVKEGREGVMEIVGHLGNLEMKKARLEKRLAFLSSKVNKFEGASVLPIV